MDKSTPKPMGLNRHARRMLAKRTGSGKIPALNKPYVKKKK